MREDQAAPLVAVESTRQWDDRRWFAGAMEALWPGITEFSRLNASADCVIGAASGTLRIALRGTHQLASEVPARRAELDPKLGWSGPMTFPRTLWPAGRGLARWPEGARTEHEVALASDMAFYYDRERDQWRPLHEASEGPLISEDEAQEAGAYLWRHWWSRQAETDKPRWRFSLTAIALNGPTEGREALWLSTAYEALNWWHRGKDAASILRNVTTMGGGTGWLPATWDWTRYQRMPAGLYPAPTDLRITPDKFTVWPIWADELTARRRLLQHAARLLYDANNEAWERDRRPHRRVKLPAHIDWPVVASLLEHMTEDVQLGFTSAGSDQLTTSLEVWPVIGLWRVLQGDAHLRRCRGPHCGRWVIKHGQRPALVCSDKCRKAVNRTGRRVRDVR